MSTVAVPLFTSVPSARAQDRVKIAGTVRDVSGGVVAGATLEALVGERIIARVTTGADGAYELQVPARTPIALRTRRNGFADDVAAVDGANESVSHDVTLSVGTMSDTLVVTASRGLESRASATQSLSVIGRADIQALGSTELADALRFLPGTSVEGAGREGGGPTSLFVRGGDSDYNVVLVDGVRANLDGGRFDFSRIAAGEIERVEVLRGAQSSLWGADAMTSVVQIITKRTSATRTPEISGSLEGGSFSTFRGNAGVYGGAGTRFDYHAALTSRATDGAFSDVLPEDDRYTQTAFDGGLGLAIGSSASARGSVRYSDGNGKSVGPITLWRSRSGHCISDARPDGVWSSLTCDRVEVHRHRDGELLPLSRPFGGHDHGSVLDLRDPDWYAERDVSKRQSARPPAGCERVPLYRRRGCTACSGSVSGFVAEL